MRRIILLILFIFTNSTSRQINHSSPIKKITFQLSTSADNKIYDQHDLRGF